MGVIDKYKIGDVVYGKVSGVKPYGAFVNFEDGVSGLIHISEISNRFVADVNNYVKEGEYVFSKIIDIDKETNQLRLSYKALKYNTHSSRRKVPFLGLPKEEIGFNSIKEAMPLWLKEKSNDKA